MQRSTLVALPFWLVFLSQACFQARASPIPRNFQPLKDSPSSCLTVIFFLVLSLAILFIFRKIYVARRRNIDPVSIFLDESSAPKSNRNGGKSMTKAITEQSGFYVGLLGSPGWETKRSVFIEGSPRHIFFPPESRTPSCCRFPFGSSTTTILHKAPAQCEITSTRLAPSNILGDKLQPLNIVVLPPEISRPPPAMVPPKHPSLCFDAKSSFFSPLSTQDEQRGDFQSNQNITLNSGPRKLVLISGLDSLQSRTDHFNVSPVSSFTDFQDKRRFSSTYISSAADITIPTQTFGTLMKHSRLPTEILENSIQQPTIKPLHFGKRRVRDISEKSQQIYSDNANDSVLETAAQDFSAVFLPRASYKTPKSFCQSVDPSSNSVWLKPRCSTPTMRTRNSPIIGPSPLRTMSLPSDYDFEHTRKFNVNNYNTLSKTQSEAKFEPPLESPPSSHSSPIPKRSKTGFQTDDPDIILDLIRELAHETSAWDASLFVDENFKALMDQSATHPNSKLNVQIAPEKRSKYRRKQRRTTLQVIPESDVAVVFSEEHVNWHPDEAQSFWEDEIDSAHQHDAQPWPPSPGVGPLAYCRV